MSNRLWSMGTAISVIFIVSSWGWSLPNDSTPKRLVTVEGHGTLKAVPDIARLTIGVSADGSESEPTAAVVRETMTREIHAIQILGVPEKDIQTQYYSIQPRWSYNNGKSTRIGFTVSNSLSVTVHNLSLVGKLLSEVTSVGATSVDGPSFDFDHPETLERKSLALAVEDAKAKAAILAESAGASLGEVQTITQEGGSNDQPFRPMPLQRFHATAMASASEMPIATGEQPFRSDVTVTYTLKD